MAWFRPPTRVLFFPFLLAFVPQVFSQDFSQTSVEQGGLDAEDRKNIHLFWERHHLRQDIQLDGSYLTLAEVLGGGEPDYSTLLNFFVREIPRRRYLDHWKTQKPPALLKNYRFLMRITGKVLNHVMDKKIPLRDPIDISECLLDIAYFYYATGDRENSVAKINEAIDYHRKYRLPLAWLDSEGKNPMAFSLLIREKIKGAN